MFIGRKTQSVFNRAVGILDQVQERMPCTDTLAFPSSLRQRYKAIHFLLLAFKVTHVKPAGFTSVLNKLFPHFLPLCAFAREGFATQTGVHG